MPEVSVIIPNYNHAPYLKQRIDSVLAQTYQDFEVIILDDLSPDNSREIIEGYRNNPKVSHIVFNETNSGTTFKQWEKGIKLASGKYIWIAESDDYCAPSFLDTAVSALNFDDRIALFFSRSYQVDKDDRVLNDFLWWTEDLKDHDWQKDFNEEGKRLIVSCLSKKNVIVNASGVVFRKQNSLNALTEVTNLRKCGDWLFWVLLIKNNKVAYHGQPLNYFRDHQLSTRSFLNIESKLVRCVEEYYVKKRIYDLVPSAETKNRYQAAFVDIFRTTPMANYYTLKKVYSSIVRKDLTNVSFLYNKVMNKLTSK